MEADERWLAAVWPFVRSHLPAAPARVLEIGCGPRGGFVPALRTGGYAAVGVDPRAPEELGYHRVEFEDYPLAEPVQVVVACTSLHHVADLGQVLDRVAAALVPDGVLIAVEWARERFDERTARWCFDRLGPAEADGDAGWLYRHRAEWIASGLSWDAYLRSWAAAEGLHPGEEIVRGLDTRFHRLMCRVGPYCFADLPGVEESDEQAAIDAGDISGTGIRYVGRPRRGRGGGGSGE